MNNYEETNYNDLNQDYNEYAERRRSPWLRIILIILGFIVLGLIILFLMKACGNKPDLEKYLLEAGKENYNTSKEELPDSYGECKTVALDSLLNKNLISNPDIFKDCDKDKTYVKVCLLDNDEYHYTPILSCKSKETAFDNWKEGTNSDLKKDKSDVQFLFLGEKQVETVKYYYPKDLTDEKEVKEYYTEAPSENHIFIDDLKEDVAKYYTEKVNKLYYNNGAFATLQPSGYPNKGQTKLLTTTLTIDKPTEQSNRTINDTTLYRTATATKARSYKFECADKNVTGTVLSNVPCEIRESETHKTTIKIYYTCKTAQEVGAGDAYQHLKDDLDKNTVCSVTGAWSSWSETACLDDSRTVKCESKNGYKVLDYTYTWYKEDVLRSYYPSGVSKANLEKTYYKEAPVNGAKKDETTVTKGSKYYKLLDQDNNVILDVNYSIWTAITEDYVLENEMINAFKTLNYEVDSLKDINNSDNIRYTLKLKYRNRVN